MIRSWLPRQLVGLVAMLAIAGAATTANAQDKLDRALRDAKNSGETLHVIVKAKPGYEAWARQLLQQNGTTIEAELPSVSGLAVALTGSQLDLCRSSVIDSCSEDSYVSPSTAVSRSETTTAFQNLNSVKISAPSVNTLPIAASDIPW